MSVILLRLCSVFVMIALGYIARKVRLVDSDTTNRLARLLMSLIYPALIYATIVGHYTGGSLAEKWLLPVGAFGIMFFGLLTGSSLLPFLQRIPRPQQRNFLFQCTINNYSFLPMPIALFFWGETGVANLIFSTLGSELAAWTLGVYALTGRKLSLGALKHLLTMPVMAIAAALLTIACRDGLIPTLGLSLHAIPGLTGLWEAVLSGLQLFGQATIPIAMLVVGSRIAELSWGHVASRLQFGIAGMRLVAIPALVILLLLILPLPEEVRQTLVLVAVMPSAVAGVVLSELFGGDVREAAGSVLLTHVLCIVTVPFWLYLVFSR